MQANNHSHGLQVARPLASELPKLPSNARYVHHENACYDWGTFGWALFKFSAILDAYRYFIFMNSSVRGPFLPSYWPVRGRLLGMSAVVLRSCSLPVPAMLRGRCIAGQHPLEQAVHVEAE